MASNVSTPADSHEIWAGQKTASSKSSKRPLVGQRMSFERRLGGGMVVSAKLWVRKDLSGSIGINKKPALRNNWLLTEYLQMLSILLER